MEERPFHGRIILIRATSAFRALQRGSKEQLFHLALHPRSSNVSACRVFPDTVCPARYTISGQWSGKLRLFNALYLGSPLAILSAERGRSHMQQLITFVAVVGGLVFSVAVALLVEELIFGQVFKLFFTPQLVRVKSSQQR